MTGAARATATVAIMLCALAVAACQREKREFKSDRVESSESDQVVLSGLSPGNSPANARNTGKGEQYETNAYHVAQGKRLYTWFNCNGCHAMGGGGSGPPLIDDRWIYGANIENIVSTIQEGRPNGMPSFRGKIPDDQIWEIAAFVRSMGGAVSKNVAPQRNDDLSARPAENRLPAASPIVGGQPPPASQGTQ